MKYRLLQEILLHSKLIAKEMFGTMQLLSKDNEQERLFNPNSKTSSPSRTVKTLTIMTDSWSDHPRTKSSQRQTRLALLSRNSSMARLKLLNQRTFPTHTGGIIYPLHAWPTGWFRWVKAENHQDDGGCGGPSRTTSIQTQEDSSWPA